MGDQQELFHAPVFDEPSEVGWYVSDVHCTRAIGHLYASLAESGYIMSQVSAPTMLELWGEALSATMDVHERSPIGPDPGRVEDILKGEQVRTECACKRCHILVTKNDFTYPYCAQCYSNPDCSSR